MDIAAEKRVLRLFEEALEWPRAARRERLSALLAGEPEVLAAVLAMLRADDASALLPTEPPEPVAPIDDAPMPDRIGNYRIIEEIGRGGMGLVYRGARDDGLFDQQVAIKVIRRTIFSASTHEQFATERRILARLHHPHIAHLLDGGVSEDGSPYIIMELVRGVPITDHAAAQDLDLTARLALFRDACEALEYAHRELVVHADVKPSNVVVAEGFGVKLLDFGIARLVGEDGGRTGSAHTPGYSSPARLSGERSTPTDDVFALGVLLDQLIAGVTGVDADLRAVAAKAAQEDAGERYGAVSELIADLDRWRTHAPVLARPPDRARWLLLFWRRNRVGVLAGVLLAATAIATSALYIRANAERALAERRFADVRSMANYIMFDLDPQMARLAGSLPARRSAAQRASQYLEALGRDAGKNPALALEIVRSHLRLAGIYGYDAVGGLNDFPKAKAQLAKAKALLQSYPVQSGDATQLALAQGEFALTSAASDIVEQSEASLPRAKQSINDAVAKFEGVLRADPKNIAADYGKWRAAIYQIRLLLYSGDLRQAVAIGISERERAHAAPTSPGQQIEFDFLSTAAMTGLAQAQFESRQYAEALQSFQRAERAFNAILAAGRGGFETQSFLALALSGIGDCLEKLGQLDEAIRYMRLSLAGNLELRKAGPNDSLEEDITVDRMHLALLLAKSGRAKEGTELIDIVVSDAKKNVLKNPELAAAQRRLAVASHVKAKVLELAGPSGTVCSAANYAYAQWRLAEKLGGLLELDKQDPATIPALVAMLKKCGVTARF